MLICHVSRMTLGTYQRATLLRRALLMRGILAFGTSLSEGNLQRSNFPLPFPFLFFISVIHFLSKESLILALSLRDGESKETSLVNKSAPSFLQRDEIHGPPTLLGEFANTTKICTIDNGSRWTTFCANRCDPLTHQEIMVKYNKRRN